MQVSETYIPLQPHELLTQIIKALREAGMTILISSHVLSDLAELCTSVGIMELGYLVESASLQELYRRLGHSSIFMSTLGSPKRISLHSRRPRNHFPQARTPASIITVLERCD